MSVLSLAKYESRIVCQLGCTACADGTGTCTACKTGFTQDANDHTQCIAPQSVTSSGTVCPDGSFSSGSTCTSCSPSCQTCSAGTSNDCILCASGTYSLNGSCVSTDANGVCEGSSLIANNDKHECDSKFFVICVLRRPLTLSPAQAVALNAPLARSQILRRPRRSIKYNALGVLWGSSCPMALVSRVVLRGRSSLHRTMLLVLVCISLCTNPRNFNLTHLRLSACDSSCGTCTGSSTFCLTCASSTQFASEGSCVSSCPSNTFSSSGSCVTCHPDCATCSGSSFSQCTSCSSHRPVLSNGRCLPTCSQAQFFDTVSSSCQSCDSSCSSCSGSGPSNCLACSSSDQVLRAGLCVAADCQNSSSVVSGLGACLSEFVTVPSVSSSSGSASAALPSVTGISTPTSTNTVTKRQLAWWEILLMALGCAFIFLVVVWLWRRRARKQREKRTKQFASAKKIGSRSSWWFMRLGEKLFGHGHHRQRIVVTHPAQETESIKLAKMRAAEEARHDRDVDSLIDSYESRGVHHHWHVGETKSLSERASQLSAPSLYSQVTGMPRRTPEPRQPVKSSRDLMSRFSSSASSSSSNRNLTPMVEPSRTGGSKNPFWR